MTGLDRSIARAVADAEADAAQRNVRRHLHRALRHQTQEELAARAGLWPSQIARILSKAQLPKLVVIARLAVALGLSIADLLSPPREEPAAAPDADEGAP